MSLAVPTSMVRLPSEVAQSPLASSQYWKARPPMVMVDRLLHCDLQTKNAMMQNGELMLIDMGEVGYGHPIIDLGHSYSAMMALVGDYEQIIGLPQQLCNDLWSRMINYYFEGESADLIKHRMAQIEVVGCVRNFSWLSLSNSFPDEVIRHCQEIFAERVTKRKDYILSVCDTFKDWTLE